MSSSFRLAAYSIKTLAFSASIPVLGWRPIKTGLISLFKLAAILRARVILANDSTAIGTPLCVS